ncbi:MAG: ROK family protein [Halocynthiibacter sp.]
MWHLGADIGGTNMRISAITGDGNITRQESFDTGGSLEFVEACAGFITGYGSKPEQIIVAAAGVVTNGAVELTNSGQKFSETQLANVCGVPSVKILNDFEGAAWSLSIVDRSQTQMLQQGDLLPDAPMLMIGPGTGLGVGAMIQVHGRPAVVPGEGGHVSLSPQSAREVDYFMELALLWPEIRIGDGFAIEAEGILSGTGIPKFYQAIARTEHLVAALDTAEEICRAAQMQTDASAIITMDLFRRYLGQVAGDLALVFNARGGVFISGGVAQQNAWLFDEQFASSFNAGGRHSRLRRKMPVYLLRDSDFGLSGVKNYITSNGKPSSRR